VHIHGANCSPGNVSTGHIVDFTTTTSTVCIRYQILLAHYYKADTNYCCCRATCLSGNIVDFTTHTSTVCIRDQVLLAVYYKAENANRHLFIYSFCFSLFLDTYFILFYAMYHLFLFIQFLAPPPPPPTNFAALCDRLVYLVVKPEFYFCSEILKVPSWRSTEKDPVPVQYSKQI
jgi:hypothetical protein